MIVQSYTILINYGWQARPDPDKDPKVLSDPKENCFHLSLPIPPVATSEETEVPRAIEPPPLKATKMAIKTLSN